MLVSSSIVATWLAAPAAADTRLSFLQFNFCGSAAASCGNGGEVGAATDALVSSIRRSSPLPDVVTVNEICGVQLEEVHHRVRDLGHSRDHT